MKGILRGAVGEVVWGVEGVILTTDNVPGLGLFGPGEDLLVDIVDIDPNLAHTNVLTKVYRLLADTDNGGSITIRRQTLPNISSKVL